MTNSVNFYADFAKLAELRGSAKGQDASTVREAARQFESLFTQMMLKSMRDASSALSGGQSLMDNDQSNMYREMFDNQIALNLSKGKGLGLAELLTRQLMQGRQAQTKLEDGAALGTDRSAVEKSTVDTRIQRPAPYSLPLPARGAARSQSVEPNGPAAVPAASATKVRDARGNEVKQPSDSPAATTSTSEATPQRAQLAASPLDFVKQMWPHAQAAARELGVDAKTLIAHAALETGWGKHVPCNPDGSCSYNLFGIKATGSWQGNATAVNTLEYEDGVAVRRRDSFRAYDSAAESFRDYARMLKSSSRYTAAVGSGDDAAKFARALQDGGYATDPDYAHKLTATARGVFSRVANWLSAEFKTAAVQPIPSGSGASQASSGGEKT